MPRVRQRTAVITAERDSNHVLVVVGRLAGKAANGVRRRVEWVWLAAPPTASDAAEEYCNRNADVVEHHAKRQSRCIQPADDERCRGPVFQVAAGAYQATYA